MIEGDSSSDFTPTSNYYNVQNIDSERLSKMFKTEKERKGVTYYHVHPFNQACRVECKREDYSDSV